MIIFVTIENFCCSCSHGLIYFQTIARIMIQLSRFVILIKRVFHTPKVKEKEKDSNFQIRKIIVIFKKNYVRITIIQILVNISYNRVAE